jgi:cell division protease FtsH
VLDPALLRPGRFDRRIQVDNPDLKGRKLILTVHAKGKPLDDDVDLEIVARRTPGFSGADLANMVNEAALLAARRDREKVAMADFEDSAERVMAGPERKSRIISEREKKILARHEVGHAVLAQLLPHADPVHKVSILQRGLALGYTLQLPTEDRYIMSRTELLDRITVFLGGRVSEELTFDEISTGAADDLKKATELARRMVTDFGMSDVLGPVSLGRKHEQPFLGRDLMEDRNYSEQVASAIDKELATIIEDCYERAKALLTEHADEASAVVDVLLERETLSGDEIRSIMRGEELPPAKESGEPAPLKETVTPPAADTESPPPVTGEQPQTA